MRLVLGMACGTLLAGGTVTRSHLPSGNECGGGNRAAVLYLFLTPNSGGAPEAARRAAEFVKKHPREVRLRPVLLVGDFGLVARADPEGPLFKAVRELGRAGPVDIPLYDEEGLRLAERWKVNEVPAYVLVRGGRAHRIMGDGADLEEVFACSQ